MRCKAKANTFNLTITAEGQKEEKKVSADDIKKVNLRFRISKTMREALDKATFASCLWNDCSRMEPTIKRTFFIICQY